MKILMATMGLDIGGAETHIVELSKALKALGHEVAVVSNGGVYVSEIQAAGIRHYSAPLDQRSLTAMFRARRILKRILRRERPDIVHAHARIPAFLCGTLGGRKRYAFVTSCHGVYQVSGMLKLLSNWGEHTLAVSEDIRDYLMEQYGVPEEQIALTINGIDTERFSPAVSVVRKITVARPAQLSKCLGSWEGFQGTVRDHVHPIVSAWRPGPASQYMFFSRA